MPCDACEGIEHKFDRAKAESQLRRVRARGPLANTRRLLEQLQPLVRDGDSLLDIGGGIGTLHHELLDRGVLNATQLDASAGYIAVARDEAARRGHADRVQFVHGDFTDIASSVDAADIVTLDRVICCYPDMPALVEAAAAKCRRVLGAVYPRASWWVRAALRIENARERLMGSAFRAYLHSPAAIQQRLADAGFTRVSCSRMLVWEIAVFRRDGTASAAIASEG